MGIAIGVLPLALLFIPWLVSAFSVSINADNLWLTVAAGRMLDGLTYESGFYEPNPPLSIMLYAVPAFFAGIGIPLAPLIVLWCLFAIFMSAALVFRLLQKLDVLDRTEIHMLAAGFLVSNTIVIVAQLFGERDQFIFLGLLPFVLGQLYLTRNRIHAEPRLWLLLFICSFFILIKPHYGIVPVFFLLHRMIVQKRFLSIVKDADFTALAAATIVYIAMVMTFFPGYVNIILPEVFAYYLTVADQAAREAILLSTLQIVTVSLIQGICVFFLPVEHMKKRFVFLMIGAGLLCLVPYIVQGRGYYYHLFPALIFIWMTLPLTVFWFLRNSPVKKWAAFAAPLVFITLSYLSEPVDFDYPSHRDTGGLELSRIMQQCHTPPCRVFISSSNIEIGQKALFYAGTTQASRYPTLWPLPGILSALERNPSDPVAKKRLDQLTRRLSEDFSTYKPDVAIMGKFPIFVGQGPFDMVSLLRKDPDFAAEWGHYRRVSALKVPYRDYLPDSPDQQDTILEFDVYKRVE